MASVDLHHPQPAGGASLRSYTHSSRPRHSPSSSLASSVKFQSNRGRLSNTRAPSGLSMQDSRLATQSVPDFQKAGVRQKNSRSSSISQQQQQQQQGSSHADGASTTYSESPLLDSAIVEDSCLSSKSSAKGSKGKLKSGLRRFSRNEDSLDFSRTAAENEEKFGLGIYSVKPESPLNTVSDVSFSSARSKGVNQSWRRSQEPRSFKPSQPYTLPMTRSSDTKGPSTSLVLSPNLFIPPEDEELINSFGLPSNTETADTHSTVSGLDRFPSHVPTTTTTMTDSPRRSFEALESNASVSSVFTRPRRSTNQSTEATTPQSRTSIDRVFTFGKSSKEPVDPVARQASIEAARQAFNKRQEAKQRKVDDKERKDIQRNENKLIKNEQRERRRSLAQEQKEIRRTTTRESKRSDHDELVSGPAYANIKTSAEGPPSAHAPSQIKAIDVPMTTGSRPRKKGIKWGYHNLVTWSNIRLLRLKERGEKD